MRVNQRNGGFVYINLNANCIRSFWATTVDTTSGAAYIFYCITQDKHYNFDCLQLDLARDNIEIVIRVTISRLIVTCRNEMSHMSKIKIELITPLERRCINLSNCVKIMDISHTQPKLLDAEHA